MDENDRTCLMEMAEMARTAQEIIKEHPRTSDLDKMQKLAFLSAVEHFCEAASRVSPQFREQTTQIPWNDIVAMNNYFIQRSQRINQDGGWSLPRISILELIAELDKLLSDG